MTRSEVSEAVVRVLAMSGIKEIPGIDDDRLDIDSLTFVTTLINLEEELDIEFPEEIYSSIPSTYSGFVDYLTESALDALAENDGCEEEV